MENNLKKLPPLERKPDGSLYRMTQAHRNRANTLILRECPQTISFSVCCKHFRWAVLPLDRTLEAEIFRDKDTKRCIVCRRAFVPGSNRAKYCPDCAVSVHRLQKAESERKRMAFVDN